MFYLIITILLNVVIAAVFKLFPKYNIDTLQAIVVNYCVCVITGCLFIGNIPYTPSAFSSSWFPWSLVTGACFIAIFNLLAYTTRVHGITTATISNKLSLIIPAVFSIILYNERAGLGKIAGIILAIPAVYLTTREKKDTGPRTSLLWPAILFVSSGLLDTLVKYIQCTYLETPASQAAFTTFTFSVAAIIGITISAVLLATGRTTLQLKNLLAGICVGVPNYFSIYFLIRALHSNCMQSSAAIPVINIGILVASSVMAILLFRERANSMRLIGLALSVVAILLIAFGDR
ncbi:MAG: DMT family transporter [Bacteroidota bacterium]